MCSFWSNRRPSLIHRKEMGKRMRRNGQSVCSEDGMIFYQKNHNCYHEASGFHSCLINNLKVFSWSTVMCIAIELHKWCYPYVLHSSVSLHMMLTGSRLRIFVFCPPVIVYFISSSFLPTSLHLHLRFQMERESHVLRQASVYICLWKKGWWSGWNREPASFRTMWKEHTHPVHFISPFSTGIFESKCYSCWSGLTVSMKRAVA